MTDKRLLLIQPVGSIMADVPSPSMPDAIRRIADSGDRQLAWQFFVFFSRLEYALKRCSQYLKSNAQANWDRFGSDHNAAFGKQSSSALDDAIDYFKKSPPRKQEFDGAGGLMWSEPIWYDNQEPLLVWLLKRVRGVRNNLFHGGKFHGYRVSDPSRDRDLLRHAIVVLDTCLTLAPEVKNAFYEGIED